MVKILSCDNQRPRFDRQDRTAEHEVDFDPDLRCAVVDHELDFVALRVRREGRSIALGFERSLHRGKFGRDRLEGGRHSSTSTISPMLENIATLGARKPV